MTLSEEAEASAMCRSSETSVTQLIQDYHQQQGYKSSNWQDTDWVDVTRQQCDTIRAAHQCLRAYLLS